jgi:hypothetical protein
VALKENGMIRRDVLGVCGLLALSATGCAIDTHSHVREAPPVPIPGTVSCDTLQQYVTGGPWMPGTNPGPVLATLDDIAQGPVTACELLGNLAIPAIPASPPAPAQWQWDYLRGIWPFHRAARLIAGTSVGKPQVLANPPKATVVFQTEIGSDGKWTDRVYCVDVTSGYSVVVWVQGSTMAQGVPLAVGQFTELQQGSSTLSTPAGSTDTATYGHTAFLGYVQGIASSKKLDQFP